jgi:hypothetical protein
MRCVCHVKGQSQAQTEEDKMKDRNRELRIQAIAMERGGMDMKERLYMLALALIVCALALSGCARVVAQPEEPADVPQEVIDARDAALDYLHTLYGDEAPAADLVWNVETTTPVGLVGRTDYTFTSGDWTITVSYPIVRPDLTVYTVTVDGKAGTQWAVKVDAQGRIMVAPDEARNALQSALAFLSQRFSEQVPSWMDMVWAEENITPDGLVGHVTYRFTAGDWVATVGYPIVAPDQVVYTVTVRNEATGFDQTVIVNANGQVEKGGESPPMPRRDTPDPAAARDVAMALAGENLGVLPDVQWEGANITPEGLIGASTFRYTAGNWVVTVSFPIVPLDMVVYTVTVDNTATGFHWEGKLNNAGQMVQ